MTISYCFSPTVIVQMSMEFEDIIEQLKCDPTVEVIDIATQSLLKQEWSLKDTLLVITTYIRHILPVYASLNTPVKLRIRKLFQSTIAISNILNHYATSKEEILFHFTRDLLLDPSLLVSVIGSCHSNKTDLQQVRSLFFGSRIFQKLEGRISMQDYLNILSKQLIECCRQHTQTSEYFLAYLSLHPVEAKFVLFNDFLTQQNLPLMTSTFKEMSLFQKRQFTVNYFIAYLVNYTNTNNISAIASILNKFGITDIEKHVTLKMCEVELTELQQAFAFLIKDKHTQLVQLLTIWGNEAYIKDVPVAKQEIMTRMILIILQYIDSTQLKTLAMEKVFLSGITSRLSSEDIQVRNQCMMVAKVVTSGEIKVDIENEIAVIKPTIVLSNDIDFTLLHIKSFAILTVSKVTQRDVDSDDEDDYSDEEMQRDDPVFLRDLIKRFSESSVPSVTHLLRVTIKLVRQKASFGSELQFYSPELMSILTGLINKYEEQNFEELKINAMVAIIVSTPQIISTVFELLFTGDFSLQQRLVILSAVGLSARELRGLGDSMVEKPLFDFPTEEIPQRKKDKLVEEVKEPKIMQITIGQGKITRKSTKLTKPKEEVKQNLFAKHAIKFFYPLANGLSAGIEIGSYNETFLRNYLSTIHLIVQASYPCHGFEEMVETYEQIRGSFSNITIA